MLQAKALYDISVEAEYRVRLEKERALEAKLEPVARQMAAQANLGLFSTAVEYLDQDCQSYLGSKGYKISVGSLGYIISWRI